MKKKYDRDKMNKLKKYLFYNKKEWTTLHPVSSKMIDRLILVCSSVFVILGLIMVLYNMPILAICMVLLIAAIPTLYDIKHTIKFRIEEL